MTTLEQNKETKETKEHKPKMDILTAIRSRAASSPVFNAMCHVFALRQRTRQQITLANLMWVMKKEDFKYVDTQYIVELQFMAAAGLGKLYIDSKGRVRALKGIQVTLQSIGIAAILKKDTLEPFHPTNRFKSLKMEPGRLFEPTSAKLDFNGFRQPLITPKSPVKPVSKESKPVAVPESFQATLTLTIDGKAVTYDLIPGLSVLDLLALLTKVTKSEKTEKKV